MSRKIWGNATTYNEIKTKLVEELTTLDIEEVQQGLQSFQKLSDNERIIKITHLIDRICPISQKIPTVLTASIIMDQHEEDAKTLKDEELILLSCYASIGPIEYQKECIKLYSHPILSKVCSKTKDISKQQNYLELLEEFKDFEDDKRIQKMIEFMNQKTTKELDTIINKTDKKKVFEEVVKETGLTL